MAEQWSDNPLESTPPVFGSGNFLADEGYADPEEARVKFQLANRIALLIEDHELRQSDVSEMTGIKQPDISRIVNGNVSGFSVWRLMLALKRLGQTVTISVDKPGEEGVPLLALSV